MLYHVPQLYDCQPSRVEVDMSLVYEFDDPLFVRSTHDVSEEFKEFVETVLKMKGYCTYRPTTISKALETYFVSLAAIEEHS